MRPGVPRSTQAARHDAPAAAHDGATSSAAGAASPVAAPLGIAELSRGVLLIRWAVLAWMVAVLAHAVVTGATPGVAAAGVAVVLVAAWVTRLTAAGPPRATGTLLADLAVAGVVAVVGAVHPWFATVYPVTAALAWGVARGVRGGLVAGGALGLLSVAARVLGADAAAGPDAVALLRDPVNLLLAGGGLGFVAALLDRSAAALRAAQAQEVDATERAARMAERESLGRQIHDSVLQALALVHKRGRELAAGQRVAPADVAQLAALAGDQERALRALILRPADGGARTSGMTDLRPALDEVAAAAGGGLDVAVAATGPIVVPVAHVAEVRAAVEQALSNVVRHADAAHAWVFAEAVDGQLLVSVRDDGRGFTFDEATLRADGKFGLLRSICGRVDDLGGTTRVVTAPGSGTELELRVPLPPTAQRSERGGTAVHG